MSVVSSSSDSSLNYKRPGTGLDYRPDIDGLRAVAILGVIAYHALPNLAPGGFAGVDVFFVISGYLISGLIFRALSRGSFSLLDFYIRRARRIFPALIVVLLAAWTFGRLILLPDEFQLFGKHMAAGAGFVLNLTLFKDFDWYFQGLVTPLMHLWSLGIEEQFYLLWPLLAVAIWKSNRGGFAVLVVVTALSFALNITAILSNPIASFYLPANRLWELSSGGMLAYIQLKDSEIPIRRTVETTSLSWVEMRRHVLGTIGAGLVLASFVYLNDETLYPGWWALAPCVGAISIIGAGPQAWINRYVLSQRPVVFVGLISYPLYLWHWPLLSFGYALAGWGPMAPAVTVSASVLLAFFTYRFIEIPVRTAPFRNGVASVLCVLMALCGGVGYLSYVGKLQPRSATSGVNQVIRAASELIWPERIRHIRGTLIEEGFLPLGRGPQRVVFLGDSNIQQYYPRIEKLLSDYPSNARGSTFAVRGYCAPGAVDISGSNRIIERYRPECRTYLHKAIKYAEDPEVDTVVIGASWYVYFEDIPNGGSFGDAGPLRPGTDHALEGLKATLIDLVRRGKRVYLVLQIPVGDRYDPHQMITRTGFPPQFAVDVHSPTRTEIAKAMEPINSRLRAIARETGAIVIDPTPSLCNDATCPAVTATGDPVYRDANHLSPAYVRNNIRFLDEIVLDPGTSAPAQAAQAGPL